MSSAGERSATGRLQRVVKRARAAGDVLRSEFEAGRAGTASGSPQPLWDRPTFESLIRLLSPAPVVAGPDPQAEGDERACDDTHREVEVQHSRDPDVSPLSAWPAPAPDAALDGPAIPAPSTRTGSPQSIEADAVAVSMVLAGIDWEAMSLSLNDRRSDVTERLQVMASGVDWERMRPVAGRVATALVAAAATGHLGRLSAPAVQAVARAINGDQSVGETAVSLLVRGPGGQAAVGVAQAVFAERDPRTTRPGTAATGSQEPDDRPGPTAGVIDTTGIELSAAGFAHRLADLRASIDPPHPGD